MTESPHGLASGHPFSQTVQDGYRPTWRQKTNSHSYIFICCILKQWSTSENGLINLLLSTSYWNQAYRNNSVHFRVICIWILENLTTTYNIHILRCLAETLNKRTVKYWNSRLNWTLSRLLKSLFVIVFVVVIIFISFHTSRNRKSQAQVTLLQYPLKCH